MANLQNFIHNLKLILLRFITIESFQISMAGINLTMVVRTDIV